MPDGPGSVYAMAPANRPAHGMNGRQPERAGGLNRAMERLDPANIVARDRTGRGQAGVGAAWVGLAWVGLAWVGLAWVGLAWVGLAWAGLAWVGAVSHCGRLRQGLGVRRAYGPWAGVHGRA